MYYEYDENCISDYEYDSVSHKLVELQKQASKEELKRSTYYYAMHDFDGSTGFDIPSRLTKEDRQHLENIIKIVYKQWRKERNALLN